MTTTATATTRSEDVTPPLKVGNYQELMYEVLRQQEHQQWRALLHCLVEHNPKKPEQLALLKSVIKEKKKVIKLFTKILDMAEDKEAPCESCKVIMPELLESAKKAKEVAKYNPLEEDSEFMKQYREFQQEIQQLMSGQMTTRCPTAAAEATLHGQYEYPFGGITIKMDEQDHQQQHPSGTITETGQNEYMDTGMSAAPDHQDANITHSSVPV